MRRWLLPEHIEDILPAEARTVERLRRAILDLFAAHGYELVQPPLLEYTESLLSGTGRDLDLATFRLADRLSAVHFEAIRVEPDGRPVIRHLGGSVVWILFPPLVRRIPFVDEQARATVEALRAFGAVTR